MAGDKKILNIATGFTTAFLGDERTLREFVIGQMIKDEHENKGINATLLLINDNYDPLNYRQLRIGVNKDECLLERFNAFCGTPISEVPDPYKCHQDYSSHFEYLLLERLGNLGIYPAVINSCESYKSGLYDEAIRVTFENYKEIMGSLSENFYNFSMKNLFRVQCPVCHHLDETYISEVAGCIVHFHCSRCGVQKVDYREIKGKLSWKLDCAARWNIYDIDTETFSKAHITDMGSFEISKFLSERFYGGKVPSAIRYGDVRISKDLSSRLLQILPPKVLRTLFSLDVTRDMDINKEFIENFCNRTAVRPCMSYMEYIKRELPRKALFYDQLPPEEKELVKFGNNFSLCFYGKEYRIAFPDPSAIRSVKPSTIQSAYHIIAYTLSIRDGHPPESEEIKSLLKHYLFSQDIDREVYHYLRKIFCQTDGPNITTLLSILPKDYLSVIQNIIWFYLNAGGGDEVVNEGFISSPVISSNFLDRMQ